MRQKTERGRIPLTVKAPYTLFLCVLVPVYWAGYGPANFLWFSDVSLLTLLLALWLESALLASMTAVGALVFSVGWSLDFFTGASLFGMVDYMFDRREPLHLRALSLFHVALPPLVLWTVYRLGYDSRAFVRQSVLMALVLVATRLFSDPAQNINWAFGLRDFPDLLPPLLYLPALALAITLFICAPAHLVLQIAFGHRRAAQRQPAFSQRRQEN